MAAPESAARATPPQIASRVIPLAVLFLINVLNFYDRQAPGYSPNRYWRGPAWFNTAWLLERGLRTHDEHRRADAVRESALELAGTTDFAEYVDPYTGAACGATGFSWTAALVLDLL